MNTEKNLSVMLLTASLVLKVVFKLLKLEENKRREEEKKKREILQQWREEN